MHDGEGKFIRVLFRSRWNTSENGSWLTQCLQSVAWFSLTGCFSIWIRAANIVSWMDICDGGRKADAAVRQGVKYHWRFEYLGKEIICSSSNFCSVPREGLKILIHLKYTIFSSTSYEWKKLIFLLWRTSLPCCFGHGVWRKYHWKLWQVDPAWAWLFCLDKLSWALAIRARALQLQVETSNTWEELHSWHR